MLPILNAAYPLSPLRSAEEPVELVEGANVAYPLPNLRTGSYVGCRLHVEHHRGPMQWLDRAAARTGLEHGEVRLAAG